MKTDEFRLGIVGCGGISGHHGRGSLAAEGIRLVSCCDVRPERTAEFADRFGCDTQYDDYLQMIREQELDGVLLATWPNQHREQVERCLDAGARNILCEKALALTSEEAAEIRNLVQRADAFLMEGFMYRHHPVISEIEKLIAAGEIGQIDSVRGVFSSFDPETAAATDAERNWRQRRECGGGVPHDFACYATDACNHFSGSVPVRAYGLGGISPRYDTVNRMFGLIEYENGCVGMMESSKGANHSQELKITGSAGIITLPIAWTILEEATYFVSHCEDWAHVETERRQMGAADSYQLQLENFVDTARRKAEPGMPLSDSVTNCTTIEALVQSIAVGHHVDIETRLVPT